MGLEQPVRQQHDPDVVQVVPAIVHVVVMADHGRDFSGHLPRLHEQLAQLGVLHAQELAFELPQRHLRPGRGHLGQPEELAGKELVQDHVAQIVQQAGEVRGARLDVQLPRDRLCQALGQGSRIGGVYPEPLPPQGAVGRHGAVAGQGQAQRQVDHPLEAQHAEHRVLDGIDFAGLAEEGRVGIAHHVGGQRRVFRHHLAELGHGGVGIAAHAQDPGRQLGHGREPIQALDRGAQVQPRDLSRGRGRRDVLSPRIGDGAADEQVIGQELDMGRIKANEPRVVGAQEVDVVLVAEHHVHDDLGVAQSLHRLRRGRFTGRQEGGAPIRIHGGQVTVQEPVEPVQVEHAAGRKDGQDQAGLVLQQLQGGQVLHGHGAGEPLAAGGAAGGGDGGIGDVLLLQQQLDKTGNGHVTSFGSYCFCWGKTPKPCPGSGLLPYLI